MEFNYLVAVSEFLKFLFFCCSVAIDSSLFEL